MRFSAAIALVAAAPALVSAVEHTINVGTNGSFAFDPAEITADLGDKLTFVFQAKNHSVVQSTFADPCKRSNINGTEGFASDFMAVTGDGSQMPSFSINVTQTGPIWIYCSQTFPMNHCQMGMVAAVNAQPDKPFDAFKAKAMENSTASTNTSSPAASATPTGGAMRVSGSAAGLLTLAGLVAGLAL